MTDYYGILEEKMSKAVDRIRRGESEATSFQIESETQEPLPMDAIIAWVRDLIPEDVMIYRLNELRWEGRPAVSIAIEKKPRPKDTDAIAELLAWTKSPVTFTTDFYGSGASHGHNLARSSVQEILKRYGLWKD